MLGKLIKHDLNYSKNSFFSIAALMIILAIVATVSFSFSIESIGIISLVAFVIVITVSNIMTVVLIFNGYRKSLFGQNGYLFLTLPVSKKSLLLSKTIGALIWFNFMTVVTFITLITMTFIGTRFYSDLSWISFDVQWLTVIGHGLYGFLFINVVAFVLIIVLFMTITLANISIKNKRLHWILAGVLGLAYYIIYSQGSTLISELFLDQVTFGTVRFHLTIIMVYNFIVGVIAYLITLYLLKKRIELD